MNDVARWMPEETLKSCNLSVKLDSYGSISARTRSSEYDRLKFQDKLDTAYSEGALSKDEHDARSEALAQSMLREHGVLLIADLPPPRRHIIRQEKQLKLGKTWQAIPLWIRAVAGMIAGVMVAVGTGVATGTFTYHAGTAGMIATGLSFAFSLVTIIGMVGLLFEEYG